MIKLNFEGIVNVMAVLGLVIGVIGAFVIFFWFMSKKNEHHFTGRLKQVYDFLHFRFYIIEGLLKFCYVLMACVCTTMGIFLIASIVGIGPGVILLTAGNLIVRVAYEFLLMLILACRHLGEINRKITEEPSGLEQPESEEDKEGEARLAVIEAAVAEDAPKECYCPQCGAKCSSDYIYCNMCGTKLRNREEKK